MDKDPLFEEAKKIVLEYDKVAPSVLIRRLSVNRDRAYKLVGLLEAAGVVSHAEGAEPREVLLKQQAKHLKLFYRAIARIRAVGCKDGSVFVERLKQKLGTDMIRATRLKGQLVDAGVLREWDDKKKGNILWENMGKFHVPKEITEKEAARVKDERRRGLLK